MVKRPEKTYATENPKRVYYLSMEFLIGRSLANNVTNLLLGPIAKKAVKDENLDWLRLLDQEPDAGLGNGGLGRLAACFLDSLATMELPAIGYGAVYGMNTESSKQTIRDGWQQERPETTGLRPLARTLGRLRAPMEKVEINLNSSFEMRSGTQLRGIEALGRPSTHFHRHPI